MHYDPPSLDDYFSLLEQGVEESAKEQYLRLRACVRQIHFNETPTPKAPVKRFNVVMTSFGVNRIGVIKAIRALTGLSPIVIKNLVDNVPSTIREAIALKEAASMKKTLKEAGATVKVWRHSEA